MNDMKKLVDCVDALIYRASESDAADDALKFSQAACNACNALAVIQNHQLRENDNEGSEDHGIPVQPRFLAAAVELLEWHERDRTVGGLRHLIDELRKCVEQATCVD